ncbi:MAG: sigma-70 family RNA polymerase sigma factor [Actinomycetota bacterium]|nr:sigma-70 family RNA polymerase sigma factor [Actinomycetota bacterium]
MSRPSAAAAHLDIESREWPHSLRSAGRPREQAVARLHALLLHAARFEVARRRASLPHLREDELDDIALDAAGDALVTVLRHLDDFRGESRFSTWVYKFALVDAAVKLRQRAWEGRELPVDAEVGSLRANVGLGSNAKVEQRELLSALQTAIADTLTAHERRVLVALALNGVPVDVLAEHLETTRGALYETLRVARHKLRTYVGERALMIA